MTVLLEIGHGRGRRRISTDIAITIGSQAIRFVIQFAYQVALARLLLPIDFGLVALVVPVVAFMQLLSNLGLSQATIQQPRIDHDQLNFLFWVNAGAGLTLGFLTVAAAPLTAWFYGEPKVFAITIAFGGIFFLTGLYSQHLAILTRQMEFGRLAVVDVVSFVVGAASSILAALNGAGYWSVVIAQATTAVSGLVLAWILVKWKPQLPRRATGKRALLTFGGNVTAFNVFNYFARNMDNILIGKVLGEHSLGLYDRAYKLMLLPISQISTPFARVANPLLARAHADAVAYRHTYLRLLQAILLITQPGAIFAFCTNKSLILILLGPNWIGAAPIFGLLATSVLCQTVSNSAGWLFISQNRTGELRNYGTVSCSLIVLSFVLGLRWGPTGVALCYVVVSYLILPFLLWIATSSGPVRRQDMISVLMPIILASAGTVCILYVLRSLFSADPLVLIGLLCISYLAFYLILAATSSGRAFFFDIYQVLKRHLLSLHAVFWK